MASNAFPEEHFHEVRCACPGRRPFRNRMSALFGAAALQERSAEITHNRPAAKVLITAHKNPHPTENVVPIRRRFWALFSLYLNQRVTSRCKSSPVVIC